MNSLERRSAVRGTSPTAGAPSTPVRRSFPNPSRILPESFPECSPDLTGSHQILGSAAPAGPGGGKRCGTDHQNIRKSLCFRPFRLAAVIPWRRTGPGTSTPQHGAPSTPVRRSLSLFLLNLGCSRDFMEPLALPLHSNISRSPPP